MFVVKISNERFVRILFEVLFRTSNKGPFEHFEQFDVFERFERFEQKKLFEVFENFNIVWQNFK